MTVCPRCGHDVKSAALGLRLLALETATRLLAPRIAGPLTALDHPRPWGRLTIADRVLVLEQGNIVDEGETRDVFMSPQHAYTKFLLVAPSLSKSLQTAGATP